jgi:hypothetical protein
VRSRPGADRTILLFHIISTRPSKQSRMVGSTLGVYIFGLIFVSLRTNKRHHHQEDSGGREAIAYSTTPTYTVRKDSPARETNLYFNRDILFVYYCLY